MLETDCTTILCGRQLVKALPVVLTRMMYTHFADGAT